MSLAIFSALLRQVLQNFCSITCCRIDICNTSITFACFIQTGCSMTDQGDVSLLPCRPMVISASRFWLLLQPTCSVDSVTHAVILGGTCRRVSMMSPGLYVSAALFQIAVSIGQVRPEVVALNSANFDDILSKYMEYMLWCRCTRWCTVKVRKWCLDYLIF
jgi:hypothetical protein